MKKLVVLLSICALISQICSSGVILAQEKLHFDFETDRGGWKIPDWAYYQNDHKGLSSEISSEEASSGTNSLKVECDFPGNIWAAVVIERLKDINLSGFETISADIYLPKKAPRGLLQARFILVGGEGWHWLEMREVVPLKRGKWVTVKASFKIQKTEEGEEQSDWKGRRQKRLSLNIHDIRKIIVRIEYDAAPPYRIGSRYKGPVYIDNVIIE